MVKNIRFAYLGNDSKLLTSMAFIAFDENWSGLYIFPLTDAELEMVQFDSKSKSWRRYDLLLDLFGCLDADL